MRVSYSMGITLYHFGSLSGYGHVVASVTGRHGGTSLPPFSSLNASFRVGDDPGNVTRNRARICTALGVDLANITTAQQSHGTNIVVVGEGDRGRGALSWEDAVPDADGLVTASRDVYLLMTFADCVPIILYDPVGDALGLVHAGWRGTVGGVALRAVEQMMQSFGSRADQMVAAIGPAIGPCCYEVGHEVVKVARGARLHDSLLADPGGRLCFDLRQANCTQLLRAGLRPVNLEVADLCPACQTHLFFSHRGEMGRTGRFAVIAGLRR